MNLQAEALAHADNTVDHRVENRSTEADDNLRKKKENLLKNKEIKLREKKGNL